ncbi:MAG: thioredoxin family protein [Mycoplasmatales bacterium]
MRHLAFIKDNCEVCTILIESLRVANLLKNVEIISSEENPELCKDYSITTAPTLVSLKNGIEQDRFYGNKKKEYLIEYFNQFTKNKVGI